MARNANPGRLMRLATLTLALALGAPAPAQTRLTLQELGARKIPGDYSPARLGESVVARGVVSVRPFHFPDYTLVGMQEADWGAVLESESADHQLDSLGPGDEVEAEGVVMNRAGTVTLHIDRISRLGRKAAPSAVFVAAQDLRTVPQALRYLGRLVRTEGEVVETGPTSAGGYILIGPASDPYRLFVPRPPPQPVPDIGAFRRRDIVATTGLAIQYRLLKPYDRWFELLVADTAEISRTSPGWSIPPMALGIALIGALLVSFLFWGRERRMRKQRERLRKTYQLGEEILGASSAEAILKRISEVLVGILGVTRVQLYIYNRGSKALDAAALDAGEPVSISLVSPPGGAAAGAVACFHYRTLLAIPDIARSPFPIAGSEGEPVPKSLLFVPMLAQGEIMGVLELDQHDRARDFTPDEQALAQHLANQIGVALRLLDQRSVQEQLFRTEKVAAVGRLISGIVNELETPLSSISNLAARALRNGHTGPAEHELAAIASEAQKAAAMVARLVSFAGEQAEAHPVCVTKLLHSLVEFREGDWKASGIRVNDLTSHERLFVLGSQGQLEQVFLNLLIHAEQSLAEAPEKTITIRTSLLAKRLLVEIGFTAPPGSRKAEETAAVLGVTRSVIAGHGGEIRMIEKNQESPRFEVDLPAAMKDRGAAPAGSPREPSRPLTVLVIEPEEAAQRQILGFLAAHSCRVVPVGNSDTGLELAQRMRFDAAFCSVHAPGLNWVELSERMQQRVEGFILLSDRYDAELIADFEDESRFVLAKPLQEPDVERVLRAIERRAAVRA